MPSAVKLSNFAMPSPEDAAGFAAAPAPPGRAITAPGAFAFAERDARRRSDRIMPSGGLGASADFERPLSIEGGRRIAKVRVAGLIAQVEWARWSCRTSAPWATASCTPIPNVCSNTAKADP